jgi:RNA polymerase sigma-70 factor, ECF subfamily
VEERELVEKAKNGDSAAFSGLVARYRRRAFGFFMARLGDQEEADDLCQEAFIRAFVHLRGLRDPDRFGPWFFSICRNCLRARVSALAAERKMTEPLADEHPAADFSEWETREKLARLGIGLLDAETRTLICLRHECGLGYAQIAKATGLTEALVKSRLFRAREKLRAIRADLETSAFPDPERDTKLKEEIMKNAETIEKAAWLMERLALKRQLELARAAGENAAWSEGLIGEIAGLSGGREFVQSIGARLDLSEFCEVLAYSDSFTERRLVEALEDADPELAERIKRSTFVFEDLCVFDGPALSIVLKSADRSAFALALAGTERGLRSRIIAALGADESVAVAREMEEARGNAAACEAARASVVRAARALFASGEIALTEGENGGAVIAGKGR